jgi:hypothetical protein
MNPQNQYPTIQNPQNQNSMPSQQAQPNTIPPVRIPQNDMIPLDLDEINEEEEEVDVEDEGRIQGETGDQAILERLLDSVDPTAAEWNISVSFDGEIDLSFINNQGYDCIKKIVFQSPGKITHLHNIPNQVRVLYINKQQLTGCQTFFQDPKKTRLEELYMDSNPIENIDVIALFPKLRILSMKRHQCSRIEALPKTLQELYLDGGALESLHLVGPDKKGLDQLAILHIIDNRAPLILYHMPASVVDWQQGSTQVEIIREADVKSYQKEKEIKQITDYSKALETYFQLQSEYERKLFPRSHPDNTGSKAKSMPLTCIQCNQSGGTVFMRENGHYIAKCGHSANPCTLDIDLFCGVHNPARTVLAEYEETIQEAEHKIIRLRLDTVFGFMDESKSVEEAKKSIKMYQDAKAVLEKLKGRSKAFNEEVLKQRMIEWIQVNQQIHEYTNQIKEMMRQKADRKEMIRFQVDIIEPLRKKQRDLKYDMDNMYVDIDVKTSMTHLVQTPFDLDRSEELSVAEPPRVVRFVTG